MVVLAFLLACAPPGELHDLVVLAPGRTPAMTGPAPIVVVVDDHRITAVLPFEAAGHVVGRVTLRGDRVTAGFVDAHAHPLGLGNGLVDLQLHGARSYAEVLERIASAPTGDGWLRGRGWDQNDWADTPEGGWPLAADLDGRTGGRPTYLRRVDGHAAWLDSAALAAAGITAATPDPVGGKIIRDARGEPTGVLVDAALDLVDVPKRSDAERAANLRAGLDAIVAAGLTGVHDMGVDDATLAEYERLDAAGELKPRIYAYLNPGATATERLLRDGPWRGDRLAVVGIKVYADGALGSRGALLRQPYADDPTNSGNPITTQAELDRLAKACARVGAGMAVHAIGDRAVRSALDAFAVARSTGPTTSIFRVEHAQVVHPGDVPRFAELGVIASMQPTHATSDMPWAEDRLGPHRVRWAYAWRTLSDAGATLAFGSDFPVEDVDPAHGIWSATTRTDLSGEPEGGWHPDQAFTLEETVVAFTTGAATAAGDDQVGSLEPGRRADLTVWTVRPDDRPSFHAIATVVDGDLVWRAPRGRP